MRRLAAFVMSLWLASPVWAGSSNVLVLSADPVVANRIDALLAGNDNQLTLSQTSSPSSSGGNSMAVRVRGDRNGAGRGETSLTPLLVADLPWGTLSQTGHSNGMDVSVSGSGNLLAAVQRGSGHILKASVSGDANAAAIRQTGQNNLVSFSQVGKGNMISITQRSW